MANNITVKDASAANVVVKTTDNAGVHTPHHNVDSLPGTVESDLTAVKTAVEILDNAISGSEMQVDVVTLPGSVQSNIGTIAGAVSGSEMQVDVLTLPNVTIGAALPAGTNTIGKVSLVEKTMLAATGTASTSGDNTLVSAPGAGNRVVLVAVWIQNESTSVTTMILKNGSTAFSRFMAGQREMLAPVLPVGREFKLSDNAALVLNLSAANSCGYTVFYYTEAV